MCGIVGLFLKDQALKERLGNLLEGMLISMTDRGPDSAGIAVYGKPKSGRIKITVQSDSSDFDFKTLKDELLKKIDESIILQRNDSHAVLTVNASKSDAVRNVILNSSMNLRVISEGESIEIYKAVGEPRQVASRFHLSEMCGSHAVGHTRMATESAVTTEGAHPFSTGKDQCLVHNGSLSNHNSLRRRLIRKGLRIESMNDTEVGAAYLTWKMQNGDSLDEALANSLRDLDGFFTFVVGTKNGFGVVRDPIACKPAVLAETDQYVAFGSEYRALVHLPEIETAEVWEPEPATVYFWNH
ncbi:MAG: glutamine amidotransferase family protein [Aestuariivita sp.]|nr:glutamine amidotransferase family protein [Aestuariivita sp.]